MSLKISLNHMFTFYILAVKLKVVKTAYIWLQIILNLNFKFGNHDIYIKYEAIEWI